MGSSYNNPAPAIWCWGAGSNGEIGDGGTSDRSQPTRVDIPGIENVGLVQPSYIAVGASFSCLAASWPLLGRTWCWGDNTYGQLGNGTTDDGLVPIEVVRPTVNSEPLGLWLVGVGGTHVCAYNVGDSVEIWCWGRGTSGQLGYGGTSNQSLPVQVQTPIAAAPGFGFVALGRDFTCGSSQSSDVWCWGAGSFGQIGNGQTGNVSTPTLVTRPNGVDWDVLHAGPYNMCADDQAATDAGTIGTIWCWGKESLWVYSSTANVTVPALLVPGVAPSSSPASLLALSTTGRTLAFTGYIVAAMFAIDLGVRTTERIRRRRRRG